MRMPDTGRACFPRVRASSLRAYTLDEDSLASPTSGTAYDLVRSSTMAPIGSDYAPSVIEAATPRARRFSEGVIASLSEGASDAALIEGLSGNCTLAAIVRRNTRATPAGNTVLFGLLGDNGVETSAENTVRSLWMDTTGRLFSWWEHSAGTNVQTDLTGFILQPFEWVLLHLRISASTGAGPGGTVTVDLFANGSPVATSIGVVNTSDGSAARFRVGATLASGAGAFQGPFDIAGVFAFAEALDASEIEDDARRFRRSAFFTRHDLAVWTTDATGAPRNLCDLDGIDFVDEVEVSDESDQATKTVRVSCVREHSKLSLAGLVTDSKLNLSDPLDPASFEASLLREAAEIEVLAARVPLGLRAAPDELERGSVFQGEIDEIDDGGEMVVVTARDLGGRLIDTHIEQEVAYSDPATPYAVEGEMQYLLNDNDDDSGNNSVAGLSTRTGSYAPLTLFVPVSPSWSVLGWTQRREPVLSALRALAQQIGWECRYRYDPDPAQRAWRLTLFEPDRARTAAEAVIDPDDVLEVRGLRRSTFGRRTNVRVIYPSSEATAPTNPTPPSGYTVTSGWVGVDGDGNRLNAWIEVQSDTALTLTGKRQFTEFNESATQQLDTITEAYAMAFGALRDLEDPGIAKSVSLPLAWEVGVNDTLRFRATPGLFTVAQTLAVKRVVHTFGERATTTLELRGKPSIGFKRWLRCEARPGNGKPGIMDPRAALTDEVSGELLQVYRNILDRSSYLTGGKFVQLRNSDFGSFSAGTQNPPDGWSMSAGTWGTDALIETGTNLSGGRAVRFATTTAQLRSDPVPVSGDPYQGVAVECSWQRVSGDDLVQVDLEWLTATMGAISTTTIYPGAAPNANIQVDQFRAVAAGTGAWYRSRAEGIVPPSTARYVRVIVRGRQVGGAFGPIIVDDCSFYRATPKFKVSPIDCTGYGGWAGYLAATPGAAGIAQNIPMGSIGQQVGGSIVDQYDVGTCCTTKAVPTAAAGFARVPFDGIWRFTAKVWMEPTAFVAGDQAALDIVLNGAYAAGTGVRNALPGGGTILDSFLFQPLLHMQAGGMACYRGQVETRCVAGDLITLDLRNLAAGAGSTLAWQYGNAGDAGAFDNTCLTGLMLSAE